MKIKPIKAIFFKRKSITTLIMRALILFVSLSLFSFAPSDALSQKIKVIIQNDQKATVDQVFDIIKQQTKYRFVYRSDMFDKVPKVQLEKGTINLSTLLEKSLSNEKFTYELSSNNTIIVNEIMQAPLIAIVVKGTVRGEKGPLPGASVLVKGTNNATITDEKGEFTLTNVSDDAVLSISFLGYQKKQVAVKGKSNIDIQLIVDKSDLDEVKIVAYGTSSKRLSTAATTTIKGDELKNIPNSNFASLLQGRVAGLDVGNISSAPGGGGVAVTLRGYGSLNSNNAAGGSFESREFSNPLWVIDGVPLESTQSRLTGTNALAEIDPANIESIEVLKDASASVLYGSRAANGVILVTTKKGKAGESKFSASVSTSYTYLPEYPTITAGVDARRHKLNALKNYRSAGTFFNLFSGAEDFKYPNSYANAYQLANNSNFPVLYFGGAGYDYWWRDGNVNSVPDKNPTLQDSINPFYNNSTNWFKSFFNTGKVIDANLQASGGSDKMTYSLGGGLYSEKGIVRNTGFDRASLLANMTFTPTKKTTFTFRNFLAYTRRNRPSAANSVASADLVEGLPNTPFTTSPFFPGEGSLYEKQLLQTQDGVKEKNENFRLRTNLSLQYRITNSLVFSSNNSLDYSQQSVNRFVPSYLGATQGPTSGLSLSINSEQKDISLLTENLLTYKKEFGDKHFVDVLAGITYQHNESAGNSGSGQGSPSDFIEYVRPGFPFFVDNGFGTITQLTTFISSFNESNLLSYLGRANYSYDRKYNVSVSARRDGSSRFGKAVPYATFPAVSASWNFSEESFMKWIPGLDFGKLRASWGVSGRQFQQPYLAYGLYTTGSQFNGNSTLTPLSLFNPDLTWEETTQTNFGLDANLFNYRFEIVFDYYNRYTDKLLYNVQLPGNTSFLTNQWRNAAALSNEGIELALKMDLIRSKNLNWKLSLNIARNWNRFEESFDNRDINRAFLLGRPLNGIYVYQTEGVITNPNLVPSLYSSSGSLVFLNANGNRSATYNVGDRRIIDTNSDGIINSSDQVYKGSPLPKVQGGFVNDLTWKNFDLSTVWAYSLGRSILNGGNSTTLGVTSGNLNTPIIADLSQFSFWDPNNPNNLTDFPQLKLDERLNFDANLDTNLQTNVNYLKLKSVVLGYNLNKTLVRKWGLSGLRLYVSGENLAVLTNYIGTDPETVDPRGGIDAGTNYPLARRITAGTTINF